MRISFRNRLLASYLLLLALALGVISVSLFVFLNSRPEPDSNTYQRLATIARTIGSADAVQDPRAGMEFLQTLADDNDIRILFVTSENNRVLYDTAAMVERFSRIDFQINAQIQIQAFERWVSLNPGYRAGYGSFRDDANDEWLFVGIQQTPLLDRRAVAMIFADTRSTRSLQQALAEFSTALLPPLMQSAIIGLIVAVILAVFTSQTIARPLQTFAAAARRIAKGDLDQQVPVKGPSEVRDVAIAFNSMVREVRDTQQAQRDFMANVSHDLKTPLTSIQGYSQAIIDGAAKDPAHAAQIIYDEAGRLTRMVAELTDLARLQSGSVVMNSNQVDMGAMTEAIAQRLLVVAEGKGIDMQVDTVTPLEVMGDGDRLAQAITNLISNALKYTPNGGNVQIYAQPIDDSVRIVVKDNGVGISADDLPRIFERFYQVDKARGPQRGTGLGLAIVKEIIMAHDGQIRVESPGANQGSSFIVELPRKVASYTLEREKV